MWTPTEEMTEASSMTAYMDWLRRERGVDCNDYHELWQWSIDDIEKFWGSIWDYFGVVAEATGDADPGAGDGTTFSGPVLASPEMPGAKWFPGMRLNYAENIFAGHADDDLAIVHLSETREQAEIRWGELRADVAACAAGLKRMGVEPGDRVVAYVPNIAEAVVGFLAAAAVGATWSSCSPDFGASSVADRFAQVEPKVLIATDGYSYGGRDFDRLDVIADLQSRIPSLEHTVVVPFNRADPDISGLASAVLWEDFIAPGRGADLTFTRLSFDHPLWVLYSSGTTGLPKAIVHSHGGILLEQLKKAHLHTDLRRGDRFMWFTTTGWMMWNFLVSGLLTEAAIVLYDGNPGYPDMSRMWQICADADVTCFGTSAAFISACMKDEVEPAGDGRDLSKLRAIGSTGSPLAPEGFDWIYEHVGSDTWLFSTSGGTDMCTAFVGGVPTLPVYRGELQARSLGVDLHAFNEQGEAVLGEVGELVITQPMPSMPVFFWGDEDGSRYRESYFEMFPGIWRHGDWIEITERGTAIIYGRSDSTINRGGIRMGTAEIYRAVLGVGEILDAVVVDIPREGTEGWMPLFVVLREGIQMSDELRGEIARRVRSECSPRHVPNEVYVIDEVPRTLSGKVLEVPIKRILTGTPPEKAASRDSLKNPAALDWFADFAKNL